MNKHINSINELGNIFNISRIVDAKNKKIISLNNESDIVPNHPCFEFWKTSSECNNCVSMRALNENHSVAKIETVNDRIYMIIASPINIKNNKYVLELIKDITDDDFTKFLSFDINQSMRDEILRLNNLLVTDELTQTFNRRYIKEKLPYAIHRFLEKKISLSILMIDFDKFKYINDTYGHSCGDYILKEVSKIFLNFTSKYKGWVARYGGDEFIIVFENLSKDETYDITDKLEQSISNKTFIYDGNEIKVTCSIGVSIPSEQNLNIDSIIKDVDKKLYDVKKQLYSISTQKDT